MKFLKTFLLVVVGFSLLSLSGCKQLEKLFPEETLEKPDDEDDDEEDNDFHKETKHIYELALKSGFTGSYEEWLESIRGDRVEFRVNDQKIEWKYSKEKTWKLLLELSSLSGSQAMHTVRFKTNNGEVISDQKVREGTLLEKPLPPFKHGHDFIGWYVDGEKWIFNVYPVFSDITLEAKYVKFHEVEIDNGNNNYGHTEMVRDNETLDLPTPTYEGYKFIHYVDQNNNIFSKDTKITKDLSLTAKWEKVFDYYVKPDNTVLFVKYFGNDRAFSVPDTINGLKVTEIGSYAFDRNSTLEDVYLPKSVKTIRSKAFYQCGKLLGVTIPDSVTKIEELMVYESFKVTAYCEAAQQQENWDKSWAGNGFGSNRYTHSMFSYNGKRGIENGFSWGLRKDGTATITNCLLGSESVINVPETIHGYPVTTLGSYSFYIDATKRINVYIPKTIIRAEANAAYNPSNIYNNFIMEAESKPELFDEKWVSSPKRALWNCQEIGFSNDFVWALKRDDTLAICDYTNRNNKNVVIPETINNHNVTEIGSDAFFMLPVETVILPNTLKTIRSSAFSSCYYLRNLVIPLSVTTIEEYICSGCYGMEIFYCEASSKPSGWHENWAGSIRVEWNYKK